MFSSRHNIQSLDERFKRLFENIDSNIKPQGLPNNGFYKSFENLSNINEVLPAYSLLNHILKAVEIQVSDVFMAVKKRLIDYNNNAYYRCKKEILYSNLNFSSNLSSKICEKYMKYISKINGLIHKIDLAKSERCNERNCLAKLIINFFKEFYANDRYSLILPAMDTIAIQNYMLLLTILRLDDVITNNSSDFIYDDIYSKQSKNINIRHLIYKLAVEILKFMIDYNKDFINNMKKNITRKNIDFWDNFKLSKILNPRQILYVSQDNLITVLEKKYTIELNDLDRNALEAYALELDELISIITNIYDKRNEYNLNASLYLNFCNSITEIANTIDEHLYSNNNSN